MSLVLGKPVPLPHSLALVLPEERHLIKGMPPGLGGALSSAELLLEYLGGSTKEGFAFPVFPFPSKTLSPTPFGLIGGLLGTQQPIQNSLSPAGQWAS